MTITISINITLEPTDLAILGQQLVAIARGVALLEAPAVTEPIQPQRHEERKENPTRKPAPAKRPAIITPTAPNGLEAHRTPVLAPDAPASGETPEIDPILPATNEKDEDAPNGHPAKRNYTGDRLPFADFDTLVGKELKRLSVDGRIPNASLWDEHRDQRLPTYGAVMQRYGCTNLASFAEKMGMQPPLTRAMTISQNGANAIHSKESEATA